MEVGEVLKGIRWSAEAGGPPKVRIGGVSGRGRGPTFILYHGTWCTYAPLQLYVLCISSGRGVTNPPSFRTFRP